MFILTKLMKKGKEEEAGMFVTVEKKQMGKKKMKKPNTKIDIAKQEKPWGDQIVMRVDGDDSEVTEPEKAFLWELHDGNLPLFLRKDIIYHAENKETFYVDTEH